MASGVPAEVSGIFPHIGSPAPQTQAIVNDCSLHPLVPELPFGGVGNSGMGKYHGEWGFRTYTNARGVLYHGTRTDPDRRYPPYSSQKASRELVAS